MRSRCGADAGCLAINYQSLRLDRLLLERTYWAMCVCVCCNCWNPEPWTLDPGPWTLDPEGHLLGHVRVCLLQLLELDLPEPLRQRLLSCSGIRV